MRKPVKSAAIASSSLIGPLMLLSKSMRTYMNVRLEELGLWAGQDEVLMALEHGGQSVGTVARRINVRPSTVSKTLRSLLATGLVTRSAQLHDQRSSIVTLTPSGEKMTKRIRELYTDMNREFEKQIEREQMAVTAQHLEQMHSQLLKRLSRLR